ncbi:GET1 [[Candida] subhashii]|uniref:Golgi to ER traffic protein 1 n=1 Tax=[Candida] subhashii TaxID=561895 RepID=A0A8J5QWB4_9ASCO|nr:GET1 [[Candida] subhashii]KAG7663415.1 GET1 [[Candida] subhashii]
MAMLTIDFDPYTVVISVFLVLIFKQLISTIGKSTIQEFIWLSYIQLGTRFNLTPNFTQLHLKKQELHEINKQKRSISAQDQYAKWTKLNRKCDSLTKEIQDLNEIISGNKVKINKLTGLVIMVVTTLPLWFFRIFARKTHLFYLSEGVFPWYVERLLAFPFFPSGTIGLTVWMYAVNSVISSIIFILSFPFKHKPSKPIKPTKSEKIVGVKE